MSDLRGPRTSSDPDGMLPRPDPTRPLPRPGARRAEPVRRTRPGGHRAAKPRYGRILALGAAGATTVVALLAGVGLLPTSASGGSHTASHAMTPVADNPTADPSGAPSSGTAVDPSSEAGTSSPATSTGFAVPADSGSGRRVVFSQGQQRVWIIGGAGSGSGKVLHTYLVSGSVTHNLDPGTYSVYSRSMHAIGVDDSGTMTHFVRFTQGPSGAAIGFHDIPIKDGKPIQTKSALGTPQSHGCIRQKEVDAKWMWAFAHLGTQVVVTA